MKFSARHTTQRMVMYINIYHCKRSNILGIDRIGGVWLACPTRVRYIVSSRPGRVKSKTIKVASTATPLRSPHYGVRGKTCWLGNRLGIHVERHVYLRPVVSVNQYICLYINPTKRIGLVENGLHYHRCNLLCFV